MDQFTVTCETREGLWRSDAGIADTGVRARKMATLLLHQEPAGRSCSRPRLWILSTYVVRQHPCNLCPRYPLHGSHFTPRTSPSVLAWTPVPDTGVYHPARFVGGSWMWVVGCRSSFGTSSLRNRHRTRYTHNRFHLLLCLSRIPRYSGAWTTHWETWNMGRHCCSVKGLTAPKNLRGGWRSRYTTYQ